MYVCMCVCVCVCVCEVIACKFMHYQVFCLKILQINIKMLVHWFCVHIDIQVFFFLESWRWRNDRIHVDFTLRRLTSIDAITHSVNVGLDFGVTVIIRVVIFIISPKSDTITRISFFSSWNEAISHLTVRIFCYDILHVM